MRMSHKYESLFQIGEPVDLLLQDKQLRGHVRAIIFTSSKVRYSIRLVDPSTTIHNIDSAFVSQVPAVERVIADMPEDNYS